MGYPIVAAAWQTPFTPPVRRRMFISHGHVHERENAVLLRNFVDVFIDKQLGILGNGDLINSTSTKHVMQCIRSRYVQDSAVTVIVGPCAHSRRYTDLEIKASPQQGTDSLPNGQLAINLPSTNGSAHLPNCFKANWQQNNFNCFAHLQPYPTSKDQLRQWIKEAYNHSRLISNPKEMWGYNS